MSKTVSLRLPDDVYDQFAELAKKSGMTVAEWLRCSGEVNIGVAHHFAVRSHPVYTQEPDGLHIGGVRIP